MKIKLLFLSVALFAPLSLMAQGTTSDYRRAYSMPSTYSRSLVRNASIAPQWVGEKGLYYYILQDENEGTSFLLGDAAKGTTRDLFDRKKLAAALTRADGQEVNPSSLPIFQITMNDAADTISFYYNRDRWNYLPTSDSLLRMPRSGDDEYGHRRGRRGGDEHYWSQTEERRGTYEIPSPDGTQAAFIRDNNLFVKNQATGEEKALSNDGTAENYYSYYLQWSPNSKWIACMKTRPVKEKRYVYYVESSPDDQLQPKLHKQEYAKPGDELPFNVPCLFDVANGKEIVPSTDLFASQYDLNELEWNEAGTAVTFEYNQRGHQIYRVLEMSLTGSVRTLVEEKSETFVNYNRHFRQDLENGKQMIWMSERDNWNHLYMIDIAKGKVDHQITKGAWYVRNVLDVDEKNKCIYFTANGLTASDKEDPYLIRYYRIDFSGKNMVCLTPEVGNHSAQFSHDKKYLIDTYSQVDKAPVTVLRDGRNGKLLKTLAQADVSKLAATGWKAPEVFVAKGRDDVTDIWGIIVRPSNFDPSKKYPVIEYIYAGPGDQYVPKSFSPFLYNMTDLAELGFIVVQIDGMGTSFRSKKFEDVCFKNLKDAGFPDRIKWMKAAAAKYPYMDIDRVGIFGASAGGQESTTAVLLHPDFYKAAYSSCGCHDNRMDKIWWNEQWMSYPIGDQYKECSNVENAHLLTRPLMLVVGEIDDNVDPSSTYQVANALINAGKNFELVVLPGVHHTMGESYGQHKRFDFFVKNLLGVEPPAWDTLNIDK